MLDGKTLEWLEKRKSCWYHNGFYYCAYCRMYDPEHYDKYNGHCNDVLTMECPLIPDYCDAAEFEERVGLLLSIEYAPWQPCYRIFRSCPYNISPTGEDCMECRLKEARLVVEQEMEEHHV